MRRMLRPQLGRFIRPGAAYANWVFGKRIRRFESNQNRLQKAYGVSDDTPIRLYDDETALRIDQFCKSKRNISIAKTSGTTGRPKQIAFTPKRLRQFKKDSALAGLATFHHHGLSRADLFVFASLKTDDSFSSLALHQKRNPPSLFQSLCYPSSHLRDPILVPLFKRYGGVAVRLWAIALSDPGVFYSTNPSTIAVFVQAVYDDWSTASALIREWNNGKATTPELEKWAQKCGYWISSERLTSIATSQSAPPFEWIAPSLQGIATWDGGYVSIYIEALQRYLCPTRYRYLSMYSMSTESVETLPYVNDNRIGFLPIASGVRYEFLPIDKTDASSLLEANELNIGSEYTMVLSDPYGLLRYHTEDVFRVHADHCGMPDLRFMRRKGLKWSFTGEKITGEQIASAWEMTLDGEPELHGLCMTLCPTKGRTGDLPGYIILAASTGRVTISSSRLEKLADSFDKHLRNINMEFYDKRKSRRLAQTIIKLYKYKDLAASLDSRTFNTKDLSQDSWASQFKLPPLWQSPFEDIVWLNTDGDHDPV